MSDFVETVITSAAVSTLLAGALVWLTKNWIGERIKGAIKHEYDQKLESHKFQLKIQNERNLELLKSNLSDVSAEKNARRDYEYEARKKLYAEYEPLLFQLIEQSENAYYRVLSLARTAREGEITIDAGGWLEQHGYYMRSTIYKLLAPIALFKIIQRNITFVDLSVDPGISANYTLAKVLYLSFTCDFEFAKLEPVFNYKPHKDNAEGLRIGDPKQFWRQGIPLGCLDNVLHECMLTEDQPPKLRTFGDFERIVKDLTKDNNWHNICLFFEIFENFHPSTRPILWRVLITQAHIHRLLIGRIGARSDLPHEEILSNIEMPLNEQEKFDWGGSATSEAFDAGTAYLKEYLTEFKLNG